MRTEANRSEKYFRCQHDVDTRYKTCAWCLKQGAEFKLEAAKAEIERLRARVTDMEGEVARLRVEQHGQYIDNCNLKDSCSEAEVRTTAAEAAVAEMRRVLEPFVVVPDMYLRHPEVVSADKWFLWMPPSGDERGISVQDILNAKAALATLPAPPTTEDTNAAK